MLFGTEVELGVAARYKGEVDKRGDKISHTITRQEIATILHRKAPWGMNRIGQFYQNAMRGYDDHVHLEVSSGECDTLDDMVAEEHAAEDFAYELLSGNCGEEPGMFEEFAILKRAIDDKGGTTGSHESYLLRRTRQLRAFKYTPQKTFSLLGVFLGVRNAFAGGGAVLPDGTYSTSQKAYTLRTTYNNTTTYDKPVVNLRDAPLTNNHEWFRLHVVSGDPNMSPWAVRMKIGTTALVAELLQYGVEAPKMLRSENILELAQHTARDTNLDLLFTLANHETIKTLEIHHILSTFVRTEISKRRELTAEDQWVLDTWEDFAKNPRKYVKKIDWLIKLGYMEKIIDRPLERPLTSKDGLEAARDFDRRYTEVRPNSIAEKLRRTTWSEDMPTAGKRERFRTSPPQTTRAAARGDFIKENGTPWPNDPKTESYAATWHTVKATNGKSIIMNDPRYPGPSLNAMSPV